MEFDEMQVIWNEQNNEKMYAINEQALFEQIKRKGRKVTRTVNMFEMTLFFVNLGVGMFLLYDHFRDGDSWYELALPVLYILMSIVGLGLRIMRTREEVRFEPTMLGELDKAIWRIEYIIKQGQAMFWWYIVPLGVVLVALNIFDDDIWWIAPFCVFFVGATYFGTRWEARKWHIPKKKSLEALRETLLSD